MTLVKINGKSGNYLLNLPTSKTEISKEWLKEVTENVNIAPEYSLIGIIYKDTLTNLINSTKRQKPGNVSVVPVFVKCGNTTSEFISRIRTNDTLIIAASDISLGHHISCNRNNISPAKVISLCSIDKNIYTKAMEHFESIYLVEFKLVPNCAIKGVIGEYKSNFVDSFVMPSEVGEA